MYTESSENCEVEPWVLMWLLTAALFALAKGQTWRLVSSRTSASRTFAYFLLWPGMDAPAFLAGEPASFRSGENEFVRPFLRLGLGGILVWIIARCVMDLSPLLAGWIGMLGLLLILHFGCFDLLAAFWRRNGVNAEPLMNRPSASTSLAEFWGARWNRGFSDLARACVFDPLAPRIGGRGAAFCVFLLSGLVHDLVISVPARGGYGLPTGYFILQGAGLLFQNTRWSRRHGLRQGRRGWIFTMVCTALPAFWVFHPLFVRRVILPFLAALYAL